MLLLSQESCFWMEACARHGVGHGCRGSTFWSQRSALLATFVLMLGGDIPASAYKHGISLLPVCLTSLMSDGHRGLSVTWV